MMKYWEYSIGWIVAGVFVIGAYAISHYMMGIEDKTVLVFVICYTWADLARYINKDDATAKP